MHYVCTLRLNLIACASVQVPVELSESTLKDIRNVVPRAEKARAYRGRGGEFMRGAICRFIECIALSGHVLVERAVFRYLDTIEDCLKHPKDTIQRTAVAALHAVTAHGLVKPTPAAIDRTVMAYAKALEQDANPSVRRGMVLALATLPPSVVGASDDILGRVVQVMVKATKVEREISRRDAETRRNAVVALADLVDNVGVRRGATPYAALTADQTTQIFEAVLAATRDYATDRRGDVGSWVREASIHAITRLSRALLLAQNTPFGSLRDHVRTVYRSKYSGGGGSTGSADGSAAVSQTAMPLSLATVYDKPIITTQEDSSLADIASLEAAKELTMQMANYGVTAEVDLKSGVPVAGEVESAEAKGKDDKDDETYPTSEWLGVGVPVQTTRGSGVVLGSQGDSMLVRVQLDGGEEVDLSIVECSPRWVASGDSPVIPAAAEREVPASSMMVEEGASNDSDSVWFTAQMGSRLVQALLRLACEKLNRLRVIAAENLCCVLQPPPVAKCRGVLRAYRMPPASLTSAIGDNVLDHPLCLSGLPQLKTLQSLFPCPFEEVPGTGLVNMSWESPVESFERLVQVLDLPPFADALLEGYVTAVGGRSEGVVKAGTAALLSWATKAHKSNNLAALSQTAHALLSILRGRPKRGTAWYNIYTSTLQAGNPPSAAANSVPSDEDLGLEADASDDARVEALSAFKPEDWMIAGRMVVPTLRTLEQLLASGVCDVLQEPRSGFACKLVSVVRARTINHKDPGRVLAGMKGMAACYRA